MKMSIFLCLYIGFIYVISNDTEATKLKINHQKPQIIYPGINIFIHTLKYSYRKRKIIKRNKQTTKVLGISMATLQLSTKTVDGNKIRDKNKFVFM